MGLSEGLPSKLSWRAEHQTGLLTCSSCRQLPRSVKAACCQDPGARTGGLQTPGSCFLNLATAADGHDWRSIEDLDVPLRQRHLSHSIDEASYIHLITGAPDTRSKALLSTAIGLNMHRA